MGGFNMELDFLQSELTSLESDLQTLKDAAILDGVIDDEEKADIDDLEQVIAAARRKICGAVSEDAPPPMLARELNPRMMEHDAAVQSAEAKMAVEHSLARSAWDVAEEKMKHAKEEAKKAARIEAEAADKAAKLLDEATMRQFGITDLSRLTPKALKKLYGELKDARESGDASWPQRIALSGNIGAVKGVLTALQGPVIDKDDMKADAKRLLSIVQEHWVDDGDEAEMMSIIEYYAETPESMEAFFLELDNHHYWGGIFDVNYTPLITALKEELEGGNGRRFVKLMNEAKSERIKNYEDPEEVTFGGVLWDDVKTGAAARRIAAFGKGFGGAAWETAKGIGAALEMLADDPVGFAKAMARGAINLPGNVVKFFQSMPERWQEFEQMTPEEQAKAIGKITFEAEMLITDLAGVKAAAKGASNFVKNIPEIGIPTPALAVAGGGRMTASAGEMTIDLARFAPDAGIVAGGAILAPELSHMSKMLDESPGGSSGKARLADAAADGAGTAASSAEDLFGEFSKRRDVQAVRTDMQDLGLSLEDINVTPEDLLKKIGKGTPAEIEDAATFLREKLVAKADEMPIDADALQSFDDLASRDPGGVLANRAEDMVDSGLDIRGGRGQSVDGGKIKSMAEEARGEFDNVRNGFAKDLGVEKGGQVHHAIELTVLDKFLGAFTKAELNKLDNMRGIPNELGNLSQLHGSKIREFWDRHYAILKKQIEDKGLVQGSPEFRTHSRAYLLEARKEIDYLLGQFFAEYRKGLPRSFE